MMKSFASITLLNLLVNKNIFATSFLVSHKLTKSCNYDGYCRTKPLHMGLFDGLKDAFTAPTLERSSLDDERETPIDRWMGWSVKKEDGEQMQAGEKVPKNFVDSMDKSNYITVELKKPMGIVFEENDNEMGGIFVLSIKEDGPAHEIGTIKPGDQLVAVGTKKVCGESFEDALGAIVDNGDDKATLLLFRGKADMFYGPTGPSKDWIDEFIASKSIVDAPSS